jgi:hypothetical protein
MHLFRLIARRPAAVFGTALAAIGLLVTLAAPVAADSAAEVTRALPIQVRAKPDPLVKPGHDPYVAFSLTRATVGRKYRIKTLKGPGSTQSCAGSLTTEWTRAFKGGKAAFDLEPVAGGKYYDFPGYEPCHGRYIAKLEWRASSSSQPTLRRFSFDYPSFRVRYLPTRP